VKDSQIKTCSRHPGAKRYKDGHCSKCRCEQQRRQREKPTHKEYERKRAARRYAEDPKFREGHLEHSRYLRRLKSRYKIPDDIFAVISKQTHCDICGRTGLKGINKHVDHNHETGAVRGLLCKSCNNMLGFCRENVLVLRKAIKYLEKHSPKHSSQTTTLQITLEFDR
jgi:hypothetical protein